jgi:Mn-dependent DtxR family transcriptional regulator
MKYTKRQADYVAYIYYYTKIHGCAPAEHEMAGYFRVSPPSVHQMILNLEKNGLISRVPGQARSIRITMPEDELRALKKVVDF